MPRSENSTRLPCRAAGAVLEFLLTNPVEIAREILTQSTRPRGRPKNPAKREAIVQAARELFLSVGIDVTTEAIAAKAGVAKATVFANFADKESLMVVVLRSEIERMISVEGGGNGGDLPLREALTAFGIRYLSFINDCNLTRWNSLIVSSAQKHPDLPRRLFDAGPGRLRDLLAELIEKGMSQGQLTASDPKEAAGHLTGLWLGFEGIKINLLARAPYTAAELRSTSEKGIELFLRLYGKSVEEFQSPRQA